jgi:hypothetical protein
MQLRHLVLFPLLLIPLQHDAAQSTSAVDKAIISAGFPHVIEALQPEADYKFSYAALKLLLKPEGLLWNFTSGKVQ